MSGPLAAAAPGAPSPAVAEASWSGEGVALDEVVSRLAGLGSRLFWHEHSRTAARSLTLVVATADGNRDAARDIDRRLAALASHQPARTIVLREHSSERLDADVSMACSVDQAPGTVGLCRDRIELRADRRRLEHADSLVRPLLVAGVPVAVWLPDGELGPCDAPLAPLANHLVLDTTLGEPREALARARVAALASARVHDLAWGALAWWRARAAAAFADEDRRRLLDRVERVEVSCAPGAGAPALLLLGWICARAGWPIAGSLSARHRFGSPIALEVREVPEAEGHGGVERLTLTAGGGETVDLRRGATSERGRDVFVEALRPSVRYARGYAEALAALAPALAG